MRVTIERSTLLKSLNHVQSVVERRNTIPILSNVLIQAAEGSVRLMATDLDIEVVETTPADVALRGATTAPAHILYDIVRKLPDGADDAAAGPAGEADRPLRGRAEHAGRGDPGSGRHARGSGHLSPERVRAVGQDGRRRHDPARESGDRVAPRLRERDPRDRARDRSHPPAGLGKHARQHRRHRQHRGPAEADRLHARDAPHAPHRGHLEAAPRGEDGRGAEGREGRDPEGHHHLARRGHRSG